MIPDTSAAVPAVPPPANRFASSPSLGAVPARITVWAPANDGAVAVARASLPDGVRRLVSALGDIVGLLAVAHAFPLVILAIGVPVALLVQLVMWILRAL
jgi:hypothetical protein